MNYENKTNEELIDLLDERDEEIEVLEQCKMEIDALEDEVTLRQSQIDEHDESLSCREEVSEKAYYAGFNDANNTTLSNIKGWLNFKVENRL